MNPGQYVDLQQQLNPDVSAQQLINNYYREVALPHLIDFPMEAKSPIGFTSLEGTEDWDVSDPIEEIDWLQNVINQVISSYLQHEGAETHWTEIPMPDLLETDSPFANTVTEWNLTNLERLALALAIVPLWCCHSLLKHRRSMVAVFTFVWSISKYF